MRKDFIVERQGRSFVLYAGLLDLAHQQGLKSIRTELLQVPSADNDNIAICMATVTLERDGVEQTFSGIGDAAPRNVAPAMQNCLIRMSETRAKARALRDAVNVGVAAFEELSDEGAHDGAPEQGYAMRFNRKPSPPPPPHITHSPAPKNGHTPPANTGKITESQIKAIRSLCQRLQITEQELLAQHEIRTRLDELPQNRASELITALNARGR
jgi:hypothetical protein